MKLFRVLPIIFLILNTLADNLKLKDFPQVEVTLSNEKKKINCKLDPLIDVYICLNENNPILVKNSPFGFMAIRKNPITNKVETPEVTIVKTKNKLIYNKKIFDGSYTVFQEIDKPKEYFREFMSLALPVTNFFEHYSFLPDDKKKKGSPQYEEIAQRFIQEKNDQFKKADKLATEKIYQVEFEDGRKIQCKRGKTKTLGKHEKEMEAYSGSHTQCGIFKCDPIIVEKKQYETTLIFDSNVSSMNNIGVVHLINNNELGPILNVRKVSSLSEEIPIIDRSNFLNNSNSFFYNDPPDIALPQNLTPYKNQFKFFKDEAIIQYLKYSQNYCTDNNKVLSKLMKARDTLMKKLAEAELAHFVQIVENDILNGSYIDQATAAKLGCLENGIYLDKKSIKKLRQIQENFLPNKSIATVSLETANELFKEASQMDDLAFNYKQEGCYARAHLMAKRFEEKGIRVDKVWLKGDLYIPNSNPQIEWNFHVAPLIYVEDKDGHVQKMVIDPTLFKKPVTIDEWDKKIAKKTVKGSVETAFPFPNNAAFYERAAISISNSDVYYPYDSIQISDKDKMDLATSTLKKYKPLDI